MKFLYKIFIGFTFFILLILLSLSTLNYLMDGKVRNNLNIGISTQDERKILTSKVNNMIKLEDNIKFKESNRRIILPSPSDSYEIWENEIGIEGESKHLQYGPGPDLGRLVEINYSKNPIDILIVGDSYSSGQFSDLYDDSYVRRVENMLNYDNPGLYKVNVLATEKGSFLRQSDWLTFERLKKYQPDIIILTYTMGRYIPTYYESKYCKEFNTCILDNSSSLYADALSHDFSQSSKKWRIIMCLRADKTLISPIMRNFLYPYFPNLAEYLASKYCNDERAKLGIDLPTERDANYYKYPEKTVFFDDFKEYLNKANIAINKYDNYRRDNNENKTIRTFLPLVWLPEELPDDYRFKDKKFISRSKPFIDEYLKSGYQEIKILEATKAIFDLQTYSIRNLSGVSNSKGNCNYDCVRDKDLMFNNLSWYMKGAINHPLKYRMGSRLAQAYAKDLYDYLKLLSINNYNTLIQNDTIITDYAPANLSVINNSNESIVGLSDLFAKDNPNNELFQYYKIMHPCAKLNHPHAVLAIAKNKEYINKDINIYYHNGDLSNLAIYIEREDLLGVRKITDGFLVKEKEKIKIPYSSDISRIFFADNNQTCSEKEEKKLSPFSVKIIIN